MNKEKMKKIICIFGLSLFLIGCATKAEVMRYTTEIFPPTHHVEVFRSKVINRDYIEIGEVSVRLKKSTKKNAVVLLVDKAKELGAEAIILMGERSKGAVVMPVGNMALAIPIKELCAIAIKYK